MRRDPNSKAIVFLPDPNKKARKEVAAKVSKHSDEIQFLADCINYQQGIIDQQRKTIEELNSGVKAAQKSNKAKS
jgi:hypothetical protein